MKIFEEKKPYFHSETGEKDMAEEPIYDEEELRLLNELQILEFMKLYGVSEEEFPGWAEKFGKKFRKEFIREIKALNLGHDDFKLLAENLSRVIRHEAGLEDYPDLKKIADNINRRLYSKH